MYQVAISVKSKHVLKTKLLNTRYYSVIAHNVPLYTIVEGTTYNHGRPEGISERLAFYEPVSRYATGMSALRTQIHGIIPRGSSLPTSPDPAP